MATKRMVATTIWTKSRKFRRMAPLQRYVFLYLVTNPEVELCGAYEQEIDDIAHYTALDQDEVQATLQQLESVGLAYYRDGWVVIPGYAETQSAENPKVKAGIEKSMSALPERIRSLLTGEDTQPTATEEPIDSRTKPMDSLSIGEVEAGRNSNFNSNSNSNNNSKSVPPAADARPKKPPKSSSKTAPAPVDPLYHRVKESYEGQWDDNALPNYAREGPALKRIVGEAQAKGRDSPEEWARKFVTTHWRLKQDPESLLHGQPFLPSIAISSGLYPRILEAMQSGGANGARLSDRDRRTLAKMGVEV